ncbi:molybdopterin-synthase adenylyltransferase MoeB [Pelagibius sp. 7325]|uniref:HesA/MoeB/ThiF family protein n=1 Tax=Pelagibius sp. 7325 TaxID=3131994 RepID=UPI0030EE32BF
MDFSDDQIDRYARHLVLPEIGEHGQAQLLNARVLVIGAGGLGSPLLLYLAAAGVGTLGIVDDDVVDLSNLQRQVLHDTANVGMSKVESARRRLAEINPEVTVEVHNTRLSPNNALDLIARYDLVADGSDNFPTRYLANDACYLAKKTLVSAAIMRFDGQLSTFRAHDGKTPCYRCLFGPQPGDPKESCADVGVLGALAGTLGALQANEVVKEILGIGTSLAGSLVLFDSLETIFRKVKVPRDPDCALCGPQATIRDLKTVDYRTGEALCAV